MQKTKAGDHVDTEDTRPVQRDNHKFSTTINDLDVAFDEPLCVGRQVLSRAGFIPPADHVLIQILHRSTRSIGLDEVVDFTRSDAKGFWAFKSDRVFRFTIDGRGYEWGFSKVSIPQLRRIASVAGNRNLVLKRHDKEIFLTDDDILELGDSGTEHLCTGEILVTVYLDTDIEKEIPSGTYTTEQLIRVLGVEDGYLLNVLDTDGNLKPLQEEQKTTVKDGMKFFSQVPQGGSS